MQIIKPHTEWGPKRTMRANLSPMDSMKASKTMIGRKQEISIRTRQSRMCVKSNAVHRYKDGFGKVGMMKELDKMGIVIGHGKNELISLIPNPPSFYTSMDSPLIHNRQ
jgi:hypothetical protein